MSLAVDIRKACAEEGDALWLRNVYPLYLHDLCSAGSTFYAMTEDGLFEPDLLPDWLENPLQHAFIGRFEGRRIGFAFVGEAPFEHMSPDCDVLLAEFFVLPSFRGKGLAQTLARAAFDRFSGRWEFSVLPGNTRALKFWTRFLDESGWPFEREIRDGDIRFIVPRA